MSFNPEQFTEKYQLAVQTASQQNPSGGLNGFELEWNLLDEQFRPLRTVGIGPAEQSFVDYLRAESLPSWLRDFSQLEVFHWMIEWATRPYYTPRGAIYEGRLMEAVLANALARAGAHFGERLYYWHGNLLHLTAIGHDSIPGKWSIAKRRYLERCVDLYGNTLATAGTHSNLSLPEPLLAWDFMHLPARERGDQHLDDFQVGVLYNCRPAAACVRSSLHRDIRIHPAPGSREGGSRRVGADRVQFHPQPDLPQPS